MRASAGCRLVYYQSAAVREVDITNLALGEARYKLLTSNTVSSVQGLLPGCTEMTMKPKKSSSPNLGQSESAVTVHKHPTWYQFSKIKNHKLYGPNKQILSSDVASTMTPMNIAALIKLFCTTVPRTHLPRRLFRLCTVVSGYGYVTSFTKFAYW
jgi:hypothetical protein